MSRSWGILFHSIVIFLRCGYCKVKLNKFHNLDWDQSFLITKAAVKRFSIKELFLKTSRIHKKTPVLMSLF